MIDYDISGTTLYSAEAFNQLMESIGAVNKFKKPNLQKIWLTTSEVHNALLAEFAMHNDDFVVAPQYILPAGADAVMMDENVRVKNRAERRKQQREERRKSKRDKNG